MFLYNSLKRTILLLVVISTVFSAEDFIDADLGVTLDYSRFSIEGGVYLDIYLMLPQNHFTYIAGESGVEAKVVFQTALIQGDVVPYDPDRWQRIYRAESQEAATTLGYVPDISKFYVEAGEYILQVDIVDVNSNRRQRIRKPISLEAFNAGEFAMSDITIASQIVKSKKQNEFTKYGHDVVPNAERTFSPVAPMLYYYYEVYNLSGQGEYEIHTQVQNLNGDVVQDFPLSIKNMPGTSAVEWGGINTAGLKSGIQKLIITLTDKVSSKHFTSKKTFYILRPQSGEAAATPAATAYANLSEGQLDDIYAVARIVMDEKEQALYEASDIDGKQMVLTTFWDRNDPDPETAINEFKDDFYKRVQMANREFGSERDEGWKTDQGRILIRYGQPNNIERSPSALDSKPFESWQYYELDGGAEFIFVDRTGYGNFQLVHSTARDEVQDYDWERHLD